MITTTFKCKTLQKEKKREVIVIRINYLIMLSL